MPDQDSLRIGNPLTPRNPLVLLMKIAGLLLLLPASVLASPPNPMTAYLLPGDEALVPAAGDQSTPVIARGGDQYLTVWMDARTDFTAADGAAGSGRDIYAARLDAEGNLIDANPIVVNQGPGDQYDPVVEWNGENWLVLWTGSEPYGPHYQPNIQAVRISPDGQVLDTEPIMIWSGGTTGGQFGDHLVGTASNGVDWAILVADEYVQGLGTKVRLVGSRVTPDGTLVNAPYYLFSPSCCYFFHKCGLAYADGVYLAVFEGYVSGSEYGIFGLRMSATLTTLDSYPVTLAQIPMQGETTFYRRPGLTAGNGQFYLTWQLYISGASSQVYGARIDPSGFSLDGNGVPISDPLAVSLDLSSEPVWDGSQWYVGWESGGLTMARVASTGTVLDPGGVELDLSPGDFSPAGSGGLQYVRAEATGAEPTPDDVFQTVVSSGLQAGPDQCLSLGAPAQIQPQLVPGIDGYLLVYRSVASNQARILAHPLGPDGQALLLEPVELAAGTVAEPGVAFDGSNYLAVWNDEGTGQIRGRRLTQQGSLLDDQDLVLLDGWNPDAVGRDGQFFVTASQTNGVRGTRVAADGSVLDSPALWLGSGGNLGPRVGNLGDYYLTVWEKTGAADGSEVVMSLTDSSGGVIGPLAVTDPLDGFSHHGPAVASGDVALIVWADARTGNADLYGRRLSAQVNFLDPASGFTVTDAPGNQTGPVAAWDGVDFLTCFSDHRNAVNTLDLRSDVYRNWVAASSFVEEPGGIALLAETVPETDPLVAGLQGNALYGAARFTDTAPYSAYRICLRRAALPTGVGDGQGDMVRTRGLMGIFPNPANPRVTIQFSLPRSGQAQVEIFDLKGARIRTLRTETLAAGEQTLSWDGRDSGGQEAPSGTYLFRFQGAGERGTGKVTLVR